MNRTIKRLMMLFLGVFAISVVGVVAYQVVWAMPGQACEEQGHWWDWRERVCARPVLISDITGRVIDTPAARAAAKQNAARQKATAAGAVRP